MDYTRNDLIQAYAKLGVKKGATVLVQSDLASLGVFEYHEADRICEAHFSVLADLVDLSAGTLVVPTSSLSLCNTSIPFDISSTPSESGIFSEYVRRQDGAARSFHPFISFAAVGRHAEAVCRNVSRYSFGPETPMARLLDLNALEVSIGYHSRYTCTIIHHIEHLTAVPYRYTKEFIHPVIRSGNVSCEPFYMYVWYRECNIKRNYQKRIFEKFTKHYSLNKEKAGRGWIYSYKLEELYKCAIPLFIEDPYILLEEVPEAKPYRK